MNQEERFRVFVKSIDAEFSDAYEVAELQIRDTLTKKNYEFSVWAEDYETQTYEPYYVFFNNPGGIDFNQVGEMQNLIDNALDHSTLFNLINKDETLEKAIIDWYENGRPFNSEIPKEMQQVNFASLVANEEITNLIRDIDEQKLTKEKLISFGKNFDKKDVDELYNSDIRHYLEDEISQFIKKNDLTKEERKQIEKSVESLHLEPENVKFEKRRKVLEIER